MNLEYLRHGKALCGKVFRRFVETFNFHNDFISNLKGDADLQVVGGNVHLDRTDERHPVISCRGCGKGGGSSYQPNPAPFDITVSEGTLSVVNCKFNFNGNPASVADYSVPQDATQVWLVGVEDDGEWEWRLDTTPETETTQNVVFNQKLYDLDGLDVKMDYRTTFQTVTRGVFKLTGEEGDTDGSNPEPLSGDVSISGKAKSGLKVKSTRQNGIKLDIKGRLANDDFAVREVKNSSDQVIAKVFGTAGFKLGGGGTDDIEVITGGEFQISGNYLQVKWTKKKIKAVTVEDVTTDWENALPLDEVTVPTDIAYSESTVEFTQKPQTILVPHADPAQDDEVVFTATPHSAEATN